MNYAYHASKTQGLKIIEPRISTHGKSWVYAMKNPEEALIYLGDFSDLMLATGDRASILEIVERFEGALEYVYGNVSGSLYVLDRSFFQEGITSYSLELVSSVPCPVLEEKKITNNLEEILKLEAEGKIRIYRHPLLPPNIPQDKSDLITKFRKFKENLISRGKWDDVLQVVKKFHPEIFDALQE